MVKLYLDIETLPGPESLKEEIAQDIKPPASMSKAETIQKWEEEQKPGAVEESFRRTALRGHTGRILCIGYIKEGPDGTTEGVLSGEEPDILKSFWELAEDVDQFVGFNILDFDLKYIWQRSVINGITPSKELNFARFRSEQIYDVMQEWEKWGRDNISLDALTKSLGIPSPKGGMHGSEVYDYYKEGKLDEIYEYCLGDVVATRDAYKKMNFLE